MGSHNAAYEMYQSALMQEKFKATSGNLAADRSPCYIPIDTTAGPAALTLDRPTKASVFCAIVLDTDGGDLTLTVTGGYNYDESPATITFTNAGNFVLFYSIDVGGTLRWQMVAQEGTDAPVETLDVDTLSIGGTAITATAAEINDLCDESAQDTMAPSTVIDATIEQYESSVRRQGNLVKTEILIDLTGAKSVATDKDIIGDTGVCHFGQVTAAINGAIYCGQMTCLEVPAGGADDIDLYMSSAADGAYDADGSALANAASLITKGGAWAVAPLSAATAMTAPVTDDYYLYLLSGEAVAGTYTAGKFLIELWGELA